MVRNAETLSPNETSWLEERRKKTIDPLSALLGSLNISNFDASAYILQHATNISALPNIAIAVSGGGYRAMLNGGGAVAAFDSREPATSSAQLRGLLQSTTYISGLSGGSWLVGSLYLNNFTTISALLDNSSGSAWELEYSIFKGPPTVKNYYQALVDTVRDKEEAGFNTSITDYWLVPCNICL